jgi:hypothetical protein
VITGEEDHRPDVKILLELLGDDPPPQAWVRGRPLQLLLRRDFAGFEDALAEYRERGFVIRRQDPGASRPARNQ